MMNIVLTYILLYSYILNSVLTYIVLYSYIYIYSGTPLIRPPTGQNKVVVLTGWSY